MAGPSDVGQLCHGNKPLSAMLKLMAKNGFIEAAGGLSGGNATAHCAANALQSDRSGTLCLRVDARRARTVAGCANKGTTGTRHSDRVSCHRGQVNGGGNMQCGTVDGMGMRWQICQGNVYRFAAVISTNGPWRQVSASPLAYECPALQVWKAKGLAPIAAVRRTEQCEQRVVLLNI